MEQVPLSDIKPDPANANKHTERGQWLTRKSIATYGVAEAGTLDKNNILIGGNLRTEIFADLDMDEAIVVDVDGTRPVYLRRKDLDLSSPDDLRARELSITLNRSAQLSIDFDVDQLLLDAAAGIDLDAIGFRDDEIQALLAEVGRDGAGAAVDPGPQVDRAEELRVKWGVESGQLWGMDNHRLICGDCTDRAVVERLMQGERAAAVVTDPPYGINRDGIQNDNPEGLRQLFDGCLASLPLDNGIVIAFQSPRLEWVWLDACRAAGHKPERLLWLYKPNDETFPWRGWLLKSEAIRVTSKGRGEWVDIHPYSHDCYSQTSLGQELQDGQGWHASVKPLVVVTDLVKRVGGLVYDPFLGSGTTLIACHNLGRKFRGCEISPAYTGVCLQRFFDFTGIEPVLIAT